LVPIGVEGPHQRTNDDRAHPEELINPSQNTAQEDIPDEGTKRSHSIGDNNCEEDQDLIQRCENADREEDAGTDELDHLQKLLDDKVLAFMGQYVECNSVVQQASDDMTDDAVPLLVDAATLKEMVKLKWEIALKNSLGKSIQAKQGTD